MPPVTDRRINARPDSYSVSKPLRQQVAPPVGTRATPAAQDVQTNNDVNSVELIDLMTVNAPAGMGSPTGLRTQLTVQPGATLTTTNPVTGDVHFDSDVPQLRVRTVGPDTLIVGKSARYEITLNNKSNFDARDVQVRCSIPAWVKLDRYDSSIGLVATESQDLRWSVEHVPARGEQKLTLDLTPTAGKGFELHVDIAVQPAKTRKQITIQEPILSVDVSGPDSVVYNQTGQWQVLIENPGTGDANDVVLDIHSGSRHLESEYLGTIPAGGKRTATLELASKSVGKHSIRTSVKGSLGLNDEHKSDFICRRGELSINVTGSDIEYAGAFTDYQVTVANQGNAVAKNVLVSLELPPGVQYESGLLAPVLTEGSVSWVANELPVGESQDYRVRLKIARGGIHKIVATASNTDDLSAKSAVETQAMISADLRLRVVDPVGPQALGTTCEYGIEVVNQGTDTAREIEIIAVCAPELEAVDVEGNAHIKGGHIYFKPLADLAADHKVSYTVRARATKPGTHTFRVIVKSYHPNMRLATEESTQFFDREVTFGSPTPEPKPQVAPPKQPRRDESSPELNIEEFAKRRAAIVTQKTDKTEQSY